MPEIPLEAFLILEVIVLAASTAVGITSFGFGTIMSPLFLIFLDSNLVVELNVALFAILMITVSYQSRNDIDKSLILIVTVAALTMIPLGTLVVKILDNQSLRFLIIGVVLVMAILPISRLRHKFKREKVVAIPLGAILGFLYSSVALGGPIFVLFALNQGWGKKRTRANLSALFAIVGILVLIYHAFSGLYGTSELIVTALFIPPLALGSIIASRLIHHVNERIFRVAVYIVLFSSSIGILAKEVYLIL